MLAIPGVAICRASPETGTFQAYARLVTWVMVKMWLVVVKAPIPCTSSMHLHFCTLLLRKGQRVAMQNNQATTHVPWRRVRRLRCVRPRVPHPPPPFTPVVHHLRPRPNHGGCWKAHHYCRFKNEDAALELLQSANGYAMI